MVTTSEGTTQSYTRTFTGVAEFLEDGCLHPLVRWPYPVCSLLRLLLSSASVPSLPESVLERVHRRLTNANDLQKART